MTAKQPQEIASKFRSYWLSLDIKQRHEYATRSGTTASYIANQLLGKRRNPKTETKIKLVKASGGKITREDILDHFYPPDSFK